LGLEASGRIHSIGPNCVESWKVGDEVIALLRGGGYAEYVTVKESHLLPKPSKLSPSEAAAIPESWLTAFQLLTRIVNVQRNESVLIHAGASGVGTAAIQLVSKLYSGTVFATAGSDDKVKYLQNLGAHHVLNYKTGGSFASWVKEKTNGRGVDVILDCVGGSYWEENSECIGLDGRWGLYGLLGGGNVNGDILARILRKRVRLEGTTLRSRSDEYNAQLVKSFAKEALPLFEKGELKPIMDKTFPIEQVADAHRYVEQNLNVGKVILKVEA